ncbi:TrbI/VirB10 family protein [Sphingobium sp. BYY-5]|uniref:TrbI/VirB10 family protein n=1 Tax=Sphingobium sp. BYY-5 TaxID=2926400 RepID=UPI001FA7D3B1|nr:TrbI/VirB10 family protein [Sphingobium sp. BYY-5]MCI4590577.1 TrbI/VirB10 family protein [Sphingobium sp. BYY-5]
MNTQAPGDPPNESILPIVQRPRAGLPMIALVLIAVLGGLLLFAVLNARRQALTAPSIAPGPTDRAQAGSPIPSLFIPPEPAPPPAIAIATPPPAPQFQEPPPLQGPVPGTFIPYTAPPPPSETPPSAPPRRAEGNPLVIDNSTAGQKPGDATSDVAPSPPPAPNNTERARAGMFADRATTVVQGTLIPAVLESGFDSSRPGFARAIVSRNVYGFDGTRVLIPRGSRLIGDYRADTGQGQKRALINWTRLIRPDGATIAVASPSADQVGRTGLKADVDTHFLERFSGAILQSALDVGVGLATPRRNTQIIVPIQGSVNGVNQAIQTPQIPPTLKVKPGASISVFVARDLDFTDIEEAR